MHAAAMKVNSVGTPPTPDDLVLRAVVEAVGASGRAGEIASRIVQSAQEALHEGQSELTWRLYDVAQDILNRAKQHDLQEAGGRTAAAARIQIFELAPEEAR